MDCYFGYNDIFKDPVLSPVISILSTENSRMFINICNEIVDRGLPVPEKKYLVPLSFICTKLKGCSEEQLELKRYFETLCDKFKMYPSVNYYTISTSFTFRKKAHFFLRKNMKSKYLLTGGPDEELLYTLFGYIELQLSNISQKLRSFDNFTEELKLCIEEIKSTINKLDCETLKNNKYLRIVLKNITPTSSPFFHTLDNYFNCSHTDKSLELVENGLLYLPDFEKERIVTNFSPNKNSDINTLEVNMKKYLEFIKVYSRLFNIIGCVDISPIIDSYEKTYDNLSIVPESHKIPKSNINILPYLIGIIIVVAIAYFLGGY